MSKYSVSETSDILRLPNISSLKPTWSLIISVISIITCVNLCVVAGIKSRVSPIQGMCSTTDHTLSLKSIWILFQYYKGFLYNSAVTSTKLFIVPYNRIPNCIHQNDTSFNLINFPVVPSPNRLLHFGFINSAES